MAVKTRAELKSENATDFPDNVEQLISPADLRGQMDDVVDSMLMAEDDVVSDEHYSTAWDGQTESAPSKNAVNDKFALIDGQLENFQGGLGSFIQVGTGAVPRNFQDRLRDTIHLLDFVPPQYHQKIYDGTLDVQDDFDCSDAMDAALACITVVNPSTTLFTGGPTIILPYGWARFSRSIQIRNGVTLQGRGSTMGNGGSTSILAFEPYVAGTESGHGIIVLPANGTYSGTGATFPSGTPTFRDFDLRSLGRVDGVNNANIGHGLWARSKFYASNLFVVSWPQDGVHINADSNASGAAYGNANNFYMEQVKSSSCGRHGIYVNGGDANAGVGIHCDVVGNDGHGLYDSSFLGNTWIGPHARDNARKGMCSHNGCVYHIRDEAAAALGSIFEPGVTPGWEDVWVLYGAGNHNPLWRIWNPEITDWIHGRSYFMDSDSVTGGVLISPYSEGGQGSKSLKAPWVVIDSIVEGNVPKEPENSAMMFGNGVIRPFRVATKPNGIESLFSNSNGAAGDVLAFEYGGQTSTYGLSVAWDVLNKAWGWRYDAGSFWPIRFTTSESKSLTGGRPDPIFSGRMQLSGFWLGETPATARYMSNASVMPTTGTWAKGDILWNNAPAFNGTPGWICTTGGSSTTSGWAASTTYAVGSIRRNPNVTTGNNYRVVPGTSAASGGPTGTGSHILDGSVAWAYQTPVAWEPSDGVTEQDLGDPKYNGGPKLSGIIDGTVYWLYKIGGGGTVAWAPSTDYAYDNLVTNGGNTYFCCNPGRSAASGGPTGTGNIVDGTVQWQRMQTWRTSQKQAVGDICWNDSATWICTAITTGTTAASGSGPQAPAVAPVVDGGVTWTQRTYPVPDWMPNTAYVSGNDVMNSGIPYYCVVGGTSAAANYYVAVNHVGDTSGNEGTGPLGNGEIADGTCKWVNEWRKTTTNLWAASTAYAVGALVRSAKSPASKETGWTYVCIQAGTSGTTPIYNNGGIADGTALQNWIQPWRPNMRYEVGDLAVNDNGKLYKVVNGISAASGGPSGTGTGILDGSVCWDFSPASAWAQMPRLGLETQQTLTDIVAGFTLDGLTSPNHTLVAGTFPATNLTCTLATATDYPGLSFRISRTAVGAGGLVIGSSLTTLSEGEWCVVVSTGTSWYLEARGRLQPDTRHTIITSPSTTVTVTPFSTAQRIKVDGTLTASRSVTLSTTAAFAGLTYRITRTATDTGGPWMLNVGTGPLKAMPANSWADFTYDGSAYYLAAYGLLN